MRLLVNRAPIVSKSYRARRVCDGVVGGRQKSSRLHGGARRPSELHPGRRRAVDDGRHAPRRPLPAPRQRRRAGASGRHRRVPARQVLVGVRAHVGRQ